MEIKEALQVVGVGFLGLAGIIWIFKGDSTNAAWALGALAGYCFKNGVKEVKS